jgi:peptide-methionine (S)-S-oxide reductase
MKTTARAWYAPQLRQALTTFLALELAASPAAWADKASLAGGCCWCMESDFEGLPGVQAAVSGFTGG